MSWHLCCTFDIKMRTRNHTFLDPHLLATGYYRPCLDIYDLSLPPFVRSELQQPENQIVAGDNSRE